MALFAPFGRLEDLSLFPFDLPKDAGRLSELELFHFFPDFQGGFKRAALGGDLFVAGGAPLSLLSVFAWHHSQ